MADLNVLRAPRETSDVRQHRDHQGAGGKPGAGEALAGRAGDALMGGSQLPEFAPAQGEDRPRYRQRAGEGRGGFREDTKPGKDIGT